MSDWFDFPDHIENNAGAYAALGGLAALRNQRAQINKLAALQNAQAQSAKTEKERLAVERRRLKLEEARMQDEKATAAAVKAIRRLMVEIDRDINRISVKYSI
jgi:xanthine dehydrogenase iron-sulfur cluster and FAD-binding subunit A